MNISPKLSQIERIEEYARRAYPERFVERVIQDLRDAATGNRDGNPYEVGVLIALGIWTAADPYADNGNRPEFGLWLEEIEINSEIMRLIRIIEVELESSRTSAENDAECIMDTFNEVGFPEDLVWPMFLDLGYCPENIRRVSNHMWGWTRAVEEQYCDVIETAIRGAIQTAQNDDDVERGFARLCSTLIEHDIRPYQYFIDAAQLYAERDHDDHRATIATLRELNGVEVSS